MGRSYPQKSGKTWETLGNPISLFLDILQKLLGGCRVISSHPWHQGKSIPNGLLLSNNSCFPVGWWNNCLGTWLGSFEATNITSVYSMELTGLYWDVPRDFGPLEYRSQTTKNSSVMGFKWWLSGFYWETWGFWPKPINIPTKYPYFEWLVPTLTMAHILMAEPSCISHGSTTLW